MFAELEKFRTVYLAALILFLLATGFLAWKTPHSSSQRFGTGVETARPAHSESIGRMNDSFANDRKLLAAYEQEQSELRLEVINRRRLYQEGRISKDQVHEAEKSFVSALKRVHEMRHTVLETDIAITEAVLGEKVARWPVLPVNGYSETTDWARFNGALQWSLKEAPRVERYFAQTFGRRLPVTAMGQSETHNRLRFDHRDAMDIALHPDSFEGKALITYLRKAGIPFTAFRSAIARTSTGPHIHIGRPSGRLVH